MEKIRKYGCLFNLEKFDRSVEKKKALEKQVDVSDKQILHLVYGSEYQGEAESICLFLVLLRQIL